MRVHNLSLQVQIDHRNGTVHFGGQQLESDRIRDHISALARRLTKALHMVQPDPSKEIEAKRLKVRPRTLTSVHASHAGTLLQHSSAWALPGGFNFQPGSCC